MLTATKKSIEYGKHTLTLETGEIGRQADAAVLVRYGDTVVLVSAVAKTSVKEGQDFFPLTVDYQEKFYAAGKIPGGFFKREGRPTEKETLTARLIDRPIRPLFPDGFYNEIQVIATVMSMDPEIDPDIPAMIGASAALYLSGVPFAAPIAAARVGYANGEYILNPTATELKTSEMDLVVAATETAVMMVESEAAELPEDVMLGAVWWGHAQQQPVIDMIMALGEVAGKPAWDWQAPAKDPALVAKVIEIAGPGFDEAYKIKSKSARSAKLKEVSAAAEAALIPADADTLTKNNIKNELFALEAKTVREQILRGEPRIDGRDTRTVRPISIRTGVLPRTHGSALFTRGETQALVVATLGTKQDEQIIDALGGEYRDRFMLHYNMPPFATGETGRVGSPKRREIGHGRLAKRSLVTVLPPEKDFSYSMRVVSEITESNGSSSMASVCGGSLALMDAGVPLKAPVAGIAMGLIKEGNRFAVLTDILGDEDHLGDMDFKVCGTRKGITSVQMDIKIQGLSRDVLTRALRQARDGRLYILDKMVQTLAAPSKELSRYAPRIYTVVVKPDRIRDIIGPGGKMIRAIIEQTGVAIDIEDDGTVNIASPDGPSAQKAIDIVKGLTAEPEVGSFYMGTVRRIVEFGAFVEILPGTDGLIHISELANERVMNVSDIVKEGDEVLVKVIGIDRMGKIRLSRKEALGQKPDVVHNLR